MVGVTTEYTIKPNGSIKVIGRGYQDSLQERKKRSWARISRTRPNRES
ncbi:MAG: hypothetical protein ACLTZT_13620 [Butyricimonas faecalis]